MIEFMEKIIHAMMTLIASEVCGKAIDPSQNPFSDEELAALYKLSKAHDLAHLVGDALIKNKLISNAEIKSKFEKQLMTAVYRYEQINYELNCLRKVLNEAQISFLPLKGSVLRRYYPEPWMRTSCDIDLLVHTSELDRVAALLTEKSGYRAESKQSHDISLYAPSGVHVELHYTLIESNIVGDADKVLESVWTRSNPIDGTSEYVMDDALFYYYHVAHMAKHFVNGGCGVRPFLDIWVLNHCGRGCSDVCSALLKAGGLDVFASTAEKLSEVWFGSAVHDDLTRQVEQFVLNGGVYGTTENRVTLQQAKKGSKIRYAFSRIWLPYDTLKFQYPSLNGKRLLLPIYEVRRWFRLVFRGGAKRSAHELKLNSATSKAEQDEAKALLFSLRLN